VGLFSRIFKRATIENPSVPMTGAMLLDRAGQGYDNTLYGVITPEGRLTLEAGVRIARKQNNYFTVGTGSSQPMGLVTAVAAVSGQVTQAGTGSTGSLTFDNLYDVEELVDPAYRKLVLPDGKTYACGWMMHSTSLKNMKKVKDQYGKYIWQASVTSIAAKL